MGLGRAPFCTTGSLGQGNRQKDRAHTRTGHTRGRRGARRTPRSSKTRSCPGQVWLILETLSSPQLTAKVRLSCSAARVGFAHTRKLGWGYKTLHPKPSRQFPRSWQPVGGQAAHRSQRAKQFCSPARPHPHVQPHSSVHSTRLTFVDVCGLQRRERDTMLPRRAESGNVTALQEPQLHLGRFMARAEPPTPLAGASPAVLAEGEDKHPAAHQPYTRD